MSILPTWNGPRDGSGCDNEDCPATGRWVTIASRREIDAIFPRKDQLNFWPLPDQATHVCTVCGFVYQGVAEQTTFDYADDDIISVDISEWDYDPTTTHDRPIRDATQALIMGAPDDTRAAQVATAIAQYVPGVGHAFARDVLVADGVTTPDDVTTDDTTDD